MIFTLKIIPSNIINLLLQKKILIIVCLYEYF
jgi:hypothetical protein